MQTGTVALAQIAAAGDGREPLSAQRADLVGKRNNCLQACRRDGGIFGVSVCERLGICVLRANRHGIAVVRQIGRVRLSSGNG